MSLGSMTPRSRDGGHGPEPTVSAWIQLLWGESWVAEAGDGLGRREAVERWPWMVERKGCRAKASRQTGNCRSQASTARLWRRDEALAIYQPPEDPLVGGRKNRAGGLR